MDKPSSGIRLSGTDTETRPLAAVLILTCLIVVFVLTIIFALGPPGAPGPSGTPGTVSAERINRG